MDTEIISCENCERTTAEGTGGLTTPEKYFSQSTCGKTLCDWCREVHEMNCDDCLEAVQGAK